MSPHQRARFSPLLSIPVYTCLSSRNFLLSIQPRGRGAERLCWLGDCNCLESKRSKSSGKLGHQLHRQALAGLNITLDMDLFVNFDALNLKAETGVQLYRVCRGQDNWSLDSSLNAIVFSPDGNFLTSRGHEVILNFLH